MKTMLISLQPVCKLIIFLLIPFFSGCGRHEPASSKEVAVFWKEGKATGVIIPKAALAGIADKAIPTSVSIRLANQASQQAIAGDYSITQKEVLFEPLIPFTRGLRYQVFVLDTLFREFQIPESTEVPKLLSIYPSADTLPENLLKIYLVFSKPMAASHSLQHVVLKNQVGDSLPDVFPDLQQELWNEDRTVLTLWMNPGRVKRDLQPNKMMGSPLERGMQYELIVSAGWRDAAGTALNVSSHKKFVAGERDALSPSPSKWKLKIPAAGTKEYFQIESDEPLDYYLLKNTIVVKDSAGSILQGSVSVQDGEKSWRFIPEKPWRAGLYKMEIEARLEDLAGNNLNRPFDRDVQNNKGEVTEKKVFEREWRILF